MREFILKINNKVKGEIPKPPPSRIMEKIEKERLSMADLDYFTRRVLPNKEGKETGRVVVAKFKDKVLMDVEYLCPFCAYESYIHIKYKRPFKFRCEGCNGLIRIPRLKESVKSF